MLEAQEPVACMMRQCLPADTSVAGGIGGQRLCYTLAKGKEAFARCYDPAFPACSPCQTSPPCESFCEAEVFIEQPLGSMCHLDNECGGDPLAACHLGVCRRVLWAGQKCENEDGHNVCIYGGERCVNGRCVGFGTNVACWDGYQEGRDLDCQKGWYCLRAVCVPQLPREHSCRGEHPHECLQGHLCNLAAARPQCVAEYSLEPGVASSDRRLCKSSHLDTRTMECAEVPLYDSSGGECMSAAACVRADGTTGECKCKRWWDGVSLPGYCELLVPDLQQPSSAEFRRYALQGCHHDWPEARCAAELDKLGLLELDGRQGSEDAELEAIVGERTLEFGIVVSQWASKVCKVRCVVSTTKAGDDWQRVLGKGTRVPMHRFECMLALPRHVRGIVRGSFEKKFTGGFMAAVLFYRCFQAAVSAVNVQRQEEKKGIARHEALETQGCVAGGDGSPEKDWQIRKRGRRGLKAELQRAMEGSDSEDEGQAAKAAKLDAFVAPEASDHSHSKWSKPHIAAGIEKLELNWAAKPRLPEEGASPDGEAEKPRPQEEGASPGEEAPKKRRQRKAEKPSLQEDALSPDEEAPRKRRQRKAVPDEADDDQSQGPGRARAQKGPKRARPKAEAKPEFGDEEEPDEESVAAWRRLLAERAGGDDLRLAFALRPMACQELRQLGPERYLGKKKEPGAQPLFNNEGKVNLQFLLASYKASEKRRAEDKDAASPHHPFLLWLVKQARALRLLSRQEVRRGQIPNKRLDQAKSSGYSLADEANLVQASDEEKDRRKDADEREKAGLDALPREVHFPERSTSQFELAESSERLRQQLRSQAERRKEKIKAHSSNGQDLQSMSSILSAPSLSFDWVEPESDEETNPHGILQVDLPPSAKSSDSKRALLRETIQRSMSFKQAEVLTSKATRALTSASLSASSTKSAPLAEANKLAEKMADKLAKAKKSREGPEAQGHPDEGEGAAAEVTASAAEATASGSTASAQPEPPAQPAQPAPPAPEVPVEGAAHPQVADPVDTEVGPVPSEEGGVPEAKGIPLAEQGHDHREEPQRDQTEGDLDISATMPFEVVLDAADRGPGEAPADADAELSATLPFEVVLGDAEATEQTAAKVVEAQAPEEEPQAKATALEESWDATQEAPSSEEADEADLTMAQRRERAWLRHVRKKRREEEDKENKLLKSKAAKAGRGKMAHSMEEEDDDLFLGNRTNRQRSDRKRPALLLGLRGIA
ncbi:unnamed protein product [Symbiodinium natans]|uniref:Uncharacterized protein n=1 Tax=Symbiodinium natans TaxID=878477 RepID=A0A812UML4_9DINO|nr:unnamed protein product [Symbiodinium natans]